MRKTRLFRPLMDKKMVCILPSESFANSLSGSERRVTPRCPPHSLRSPLPLKIGIIIPLLHLAGISQVFQIFSNTAASLVGSRATSFQQFNRNTTYSGCLSRFHATKRLLNFRSRWGQVLRFKYPSLAAERPVAPHNIWQTSAKPRLPPGLFRPQRIQKTAWGCASSQPE